MFNDKLYITLLQKYNHEMYSLYRRYIVCHVYLGFAMHGVQEGCGP